MRSIVSNRRFVLRVLALMASVATLVFVGDACKPGGKEGDACNPLVLREEENCNSGLTCKPATCSTSYCCPKTGTSSDPNCNAEGCPDPDAGADSAADAGDAAEDVTDGGLPVEAATDDASTDAGDGG